MKLKKGLAVLSITVLFLSATAHAQQFGEQAVIPQSPIRSLNDCDSDAASFIVNEDIYESRLKGVWGAQTQQFTDKQIAQVGENIPEIKKRLDQRSKALQEEWEALKKEKEEIDRLGSGRTLQGSRANRWVKRVQAYNQRMVKYNEENEKLRQDIEEFEAAVKNMEAVTREASESRPDTGEQLDALDAELSKMGLAAPSSVENQEEIEQITALLERKRVEMEEEYNALQEERQRVATGRQEGGGYGASGSTVEQQVYEINEKINEYAKKRKLFNDVVHSVNEILGQNIQPLPGP